MFEMINFKFSIGLAFLIWEGIRNFTFVNDKSVNAVRTTWNTSEDENEISMSFEMRGKYKAENIRVRVADDMLFICVDQEGFGSDGNNIKSSCYDSQIQLPSNSRKEDITAVFKNSVLYICVPKITKSHHKLVHIPVTNVY